MATPYNPWSTGKFVDPIMEEFFASGKGNTAYGQPFIRPATPTTRASEADALAAAQANWSRLNANQIGAGLGWTAEELSQLISNQANKSLYYNANNPPPGSIGGPGQAMSGTNLAVPSTAPLGSNNPTLPADPRSTPPGVKAPTTPGAFNSMQDMWKAGVNLNQGTTPSRPQISGETSGGFNPISPQISQTDYQLKQGETPDAYNTRIAGLRGGQFTAPPTSSQISSQISQADYQMKPGEGIDTYNARIAGLRATQPPETAPGQTGMPVLPNISPEAQNAVNKAEMTYQQALQLSPDQLSTQGDLDRLIESFKKGYQNIEDQPIAMEFITGQQQSLEKRAELLAEPLEKKLARMQAARVASLEASRFSLDRADRTANQQREDAQLAQQRADQAALRAEETRRYNQGVTFDQQKFDEDKRRFGLQYAMDQQKASQSGGGGIGGGISGGTSGGVNATTIAAMMANPALFDSLTPTMKAAYLPALAAAGFTGQSNSPYLASVATQGRQAVSGLLSIAESSPGIFGRTAALPLPDSLRSDAFRNYKAQLDFLRGNVIPAALTAMREASKTGGALGQVSDREGAWLGSSLGALSMDQSADSVIRQLKLIDESMTRWQEAVKKYGGAPTSSTTSPAAMQLPDGTIVRLQPDGTYR